MHRLQEKSSLTDFDRQFRKKGIRYLAGIDEAGRGPLAGPVVAAAVIFTAEVSIPKLNDSKQVGESLREKLFDEIRQKALSFGIGSASVEEIQKFNILQATFLAMRRAVEQLSVEPDYILVDGRDYPLFPNKRENGSIAGQAVVKGDARSQVIAAASILAKVHRDRLMKHYADDFPQYGFEKHKGYGTREHRQKILEYGPSPIHRQKFIQRLLQHEGRLF